MLVKWFTSCGIVVMLHLTHATLLVVFACLKAMSNIYLSDSGTFIFQTVLVSETPVLEILYIKCNRKNADMWLTCQEGVLICISTDMPNKSFENSEMFRYLRTTVTKQINIHEEINVRRKSGTACYHSIQNIFLPTSV